MSYITVERLDDILDGLSPMLTRLESGDSFIQIREPENIREIIAALRDYRRLREGLEFSGYDRATYKHREGCLALSHGEAMTGSVCQCGAVERADRWYQIKLGPNEVVQP